MATSGATSDREKGRNPFAIDLFNYIWNKFGYAKGDIHNSVKTYFTEEIGDAVMCMMVMSRGCLYKVLSNVYIRTQQDAVIVTRKLCKTRQRYREDHGAQNFQLFIEFCAIIAEVHLYCCSGKGYQFDEIVFTSWDLIMNRKFIQKLMSEGGWSQLKTHVTIFANLTSIINENFTPFEYPYAECSIIEDLAEEFSAVSLSYVPTFRHLYSGSNFREGVILFHEQEKIKMRIERLQAQAIEETVASNITRINSQIATQHRRLNRLIESTDWSEMMIMERIKTFSPFYPPTDSEEEDSDDADAVVEMCTNASANIPTASSVSHKKRKSKKKKKKSVEQESGQEQIVSPFDKSPRFEGSAPPQGASSTVRPLRIPIASATPPAVEAPSATPPAVEAPSATPPAVKAPSATPPAVKAPSATPPAVEAPSATRPTSKKGRKKN